MAKENDLFLNQLVNPEFSAFDFKVAGLDTTNTSIQDKSVYKNLDFVKNNTALQTNGKFDEAKFDAMYDYAMSNYNQMANNAVSEDIGRHAEFFRDNIYAPAEKRKQDLGYSVQRVANPLREQKSTVRVGEIKENPLSLREIAQTQRVWDSKTDSWQDAPNDSFFANFADTRVLAQWDEDGTHEDPITGEIVEHKKGDKKINDNGTYYYENLNGRSVYGREVLSKTDTLTTDGSAWNKFDIFDADDKDENITKTLLRNAIKVVPAFIGGVAPWYIGARVAMNTANLVAKLGNIVTGNNNSLFHNMEAYVDSLGFSQSDYTRGGISGTVTGDNPNSSKYITPHAWSLESMLGLAADTFTQLAEQRWIFKYPIQAVKGKMVFDEGLQEAFKNKIVQERSLKTGKMIADDMAKAYAKGLGEDFGAMEAEAHIMNSLYAQQQLDAYLKGAQKIGEKLSLAYMTGITVADSYGEALEEGATPTEAALLTLGYALGEYKICASDLGKWILPEMRMERNRWELIGKRLAEAGLDESSALQSKTKAKASDWVSRILRLGSQTALGDYKKAADGTLKMTSKALIANALGEGTEEVSEELLYDFTKALYNNTVFKLTGNNTKLSSFDGVFDDRGVDGLGDLFNRYALNFVGGVIGGGLGEALPTYREASQFKNMDKQQAYEALVQLVKEGYGEDFKKVVNKSTWAPKDLSYDMDESGNFKPAEDKEHSQNAVIKNLLNQQVDMIDSILSSQGAKLSDKSLIARLTDVKDARKEFKALALGQSKIATKFIEGYNLLLTNLVKHKATLIGLDQVANEKSKDSAKPEENAAAQEVTEKQRKELEAQIKQEEEALQEYLNGKKSPEFIKRVLFEVTNPLVSQFKNTTFINFVENKYKKKANECTDQELESAKSEWEKVKDYEAADLVDNIYDLFEDVNLRSTDIVNGYVNRYFGNDNVVNIFGRTIDDYAQDVLVKNDDNVALSEVKGFEESEANGKQNFNVNVSPLTMLAYSLIRMGKEQGIDVTRYQDALKQNFEDQNGASPKSQMAVGYQMNDLISNAADSSGILDNPQLYNATLDFIKNSPYITVVQRNQLKNTLNKVLNGLDPEGANHDTSVQRILDLQAAIDNNQNYSPIQEFIDEFSLNLRGNTQPKLSELISKIDAQINMKGNEGSIESFSFDDEETEKQLDNALGTIAMVKAVVNAARNDKARHGDVFGYNNTVNELTPGSKLAEIDSNVADTILQELSSEENRLNYYKRIVDLNSKNVLRTHDRTGVKAKVLLYKKTKERFSASNWPPSSWNQDANQEIKDSFNDDSFKLLNKLVADDTQANYNLNPQDTLQLEQEWKLLNEKLHKFFIDNQANIEDENKLAELADMRVTGLYQLDTSILNQHSEEISNSSWWWWLASRAAMDVNTYKQYELNTFKSNDSFAPVPGQEIATEIAFSAITNKKIFNLFGKAQNKALQEFVKGHEDEKPGDPFYDQYFPNRVDMLSEIGSDSSNSINYAATVLAEGIAGSGKSTGFTKHLIDMLGMDENIKKEVLGNIWFVHTSKAQAQNLAKSLFGEEAANQLADNCFSHQSIMQHIAGTNDKGHTWNETFDPTTGDVIINPDDIVQEQGKTLRYNYGIKTGIKAPTLIITDEVSHMSQPSLGLISDFVNETGGVHLTLGDFEQSGLRGIAKDLKIVDNAGNVVGTSENYSYQLDNTNIVHVPKLGQSLRSKNKLKDNNNAKFREVKSLILQNQAPSTVLNYHESQEEGLIGDKIIYKNAIDSDPNAFEQQVVDLLKRTKALGSDKKLGYIYDKEFDSNGNEVESTTTKIIKKLNESEEFKGLVDFNSSYAAQGKENPYYVVSLNRDVSKVQTPEYLADFYTGLTRAEVGSLLVLNQDIANALKISSQHVEKAPKFIIGDNAIKAYKERKYNLYKEVYGEPEEGKKLVFQQYKDPTRTIISPTNNAEPEVPDGEPEIGTIVQDGDDEEWEIIGYEKQNNGTYKAKLKNVNTGKEVTITTDELDDYTTVVSNTGSNSAGGITTVKGNRNGTEGLTNKGDDVQMMHHSFNAYETSLVYDPNTKTYKFSENFLENRKDNVIGLARVVNDITTSDQAAKQKLLSLDSTELNALKQAHKLIFDIARTGTSSDEIIDSINDVLQVRFQGKKLPDGAFVRFAYKSCLPYKAFIDGSGKPDTTKVSAYHNEKFAKPYEEKVAHNVNTDTQSFSDTNTSTINMIVIDKDGKELFEITCATDTNPVTLALTKGFEADASGQDIKAWVTKRREEILNDANIDSDKKFSQLVDELYAALFNPNELGKHSQAKKLIHQIDLFWAHQKIMMGNIKFLTTEDANGNKDWLIPGRDWESSGVIINDSENISMTNNLPYYAQYGGEWLKFSDIEREGAISMCGKVLMATANTRINKKNGAVVEIKAGKPFVIVSDDTNSYNNQFTTPQQWMEALYDENATHVTAVYIEPPSTDFGGYMQYLVQYYGNTATTSDRIGTASTSYRILRELIKSTEGKKFLRERFEKLYQYKQPTQVDEGLASLEKVLDQLDSLEGKVTSSNENAVVDLLKSRVVDEYATKESRPNYITNLVRLYPNTTIGSSIDRVLRFVVQGYYPINKVPADLAFEKLSSANAQNNIKTIDDLIKQGSTYRRGIFRKVSYIQANTGVQYKDFRETTLPINEAWFNARIDTGAWRTVGDRAVEYQSQKDAMLLGVGRAKKIDYTDHEMYVKEDMKSLADPPKVVKKQTSISTVDLFKSFDIKGKDTIESLSKKSRTYLLQKYIDTNLSGAGITVNNITADKIDPAKFKTMFDTALNNKEISYVENGTILITPEDLKPNILRTSETFKGFFEITPGVLGCTIEDSAGNETKYSLAFNIEIKNNKHCIKDIASTLYTPTTNPPSTGLNWNSVDDVRQAIITKYGANTKVTNETATQLYARYTAATNNSVLTIDDIINSTDVLYQNPDGSQVLSSLADVVHSIEDNATDDYKNVMDYLRDPSGKLFGYEIASTDIGKPHKYYQINKYDVDASGNLILDTSETTLQDFYNAINEAQNFLQTNHITKYSDTVISHITGLAAKNFHTSGFNYKSELALAVDSSGEKYLISKQDIVDKMNISDFGFTEDNFAELDLANHTYKDEDGNVKTFNGDWVFTPTGDGSYKLENKTISTTKTFIGLDGVEVDLENLTPENSIILDSFDSFGEGSQLSADLQFLGITKGSGPIAFSNDLLESIVASINAAKLIDVSDSINNELKSKLNQTKSNFDKLVNRAKGLSPTDTSMIAIQNRMKEYINYYNFLNALLYKLGINPDEGTRCN